MSKITSVYICQQCGFQSSQFLGRCPQCEAWNSLVEQITAETPTNQKNTKISARQAQVVDLSSISKANYERVQTSIDEFNRVLGGGIVRGSVILVSGDPGIGKSTLLTQIALELENTLYVAGEESATQIKIRADRIKINSHLKVLNETDVDVINAVVEELKPSLVIIDSIQTLETQDLTGVAGSVGQVRESAHRLQRLAKRLHIPILLVGHVTKEGTVAGPKTLEHLVDVVLSLEGEATNQFRILRTTKNRFGATDEVGIFDMTDKGMTEVKNPSTLFLETKEQVAGSAVVPILTGLRPLLIEVQALVTKTNLPVPRRTGSGVDNNRLQLLVAVLQKRLKLPLYDQDIFVNITGGLKVTEPAADLAICMAIISSFKDKALPKNTAYVGEVGLLGEIREVNRLEKRINEAMNLGFKDVISARTAKYLPEIVAK